MPRTKAGLRMFAEALGIRMAKHGVAVTLVSPGFIDTPMSRQVHRAQALPDERRHGRCGSSRAASRRGARTIVVPWQFAVIRALTGLLPRAAAAADAFARMTTAPDLGPESGLLARFRAQPLGRLGLQLLRWAIPVSCW